MNDARELLPIGFIPAILPKEMHEAFAAIDEQVGTLLDLTPEQRKQVRDIARAHAKNNDGRLPNLVGVARHVRGRDLEPVSAETLVGCVRAFEATQK
jgi:hypothetical protein